MNTEHAYSCRCEDCVSYGTNTETARRLTDWRLSEFLRLGFELKTAERFARRRIDVDLQQARDLIEQGCSPATAGRILQPL